MGNSKTFTFISLPRNLSELRALPESNLLTPHQTAALTVAALCRYGENVQECLDMLNYLKGPQPLSNHGIQFLRDRLTGKTYKPFSFFNGATPENDYIPFMPYQITVFDGPYSFDDEYYAKLMIRSGVRIAREKLNCVKNPVQNNGFCGKSICWRISENRNLPMNGRENEKIFF